MAKAKTYTPYIFDEFFASGMEETVSPFLKLSSRKWGRNLPLRSSLLSAFFLLSAFGLSFFHLPLSNLCLVLVYFLSGTPALINSLEDLKNLEVNIDVLMTIAALLSVTIGSGLEGGLLLVLFEIAGAMEGLVSQKTKSAVFSLKNLAPQFATVIGEDGKRFERSVREIAVGTKIAIRAGDVIPLDGTVIDGSSSVNLAHLTGESGAINKQIDDDVPAGATNIDGRLTLKVTRTSNDSTLARIITLITQAQEAKPRVQRFLDTFGKWYALTIMSLSFLFAISLPWIFNMPYLTPEGSIYRALTFLIAASPCALIIATPTAYLSALSACARKGILLKGGLMLDALARIKKVAFDKTGTLTTGQLQCTEIKALTNTALTPDDALTIAHTLEANTRHPIASAINSYAEKKELPELKLENFKSIPGGGIEGRVELGGQSIEAAVGNRAFIATKTKLPLPETEEGVNMTLLLAGEALFLFNFTDELREELPKLFALLKEEHAIDPVMLTGDHMPNARAVAATLGLSHFHADLTPEAKMKKVIEMSEKGDLAMVGDGINDGPALARANVGIAMGAMGSATAIEASDVIFLNDSIDELPWLLSRSKKALRIVKQNLGLAFAVIAIAPTLGLLGIVPLWLAVILHEGGTLLVGLNSLRLLRK